MGCIITNQVRFADEKERLDFFNYRIIVHEKLVRGICAGILESREDVDDAVQETMLAAWSKLDSLRDEEAARAWLCTIARRSALDIKEAARRDLSMNGAGDSGKAIEDLISATAPGPEEQLLQQSRFELVNAAYLMLPQKYRQLLYLRFTLCLEGSEIERIMGMESRGRINACYKAKAALRTNLSKLQM